MGMSKINWDALYTSSVDEYRVPEEPDPGDKVTVRFRTKREDVDAVYTYLHDSESMLRMFICGSDTYFDYYEASFKVEDKCICYSFYIDKGEERLHYNRLGVSEKMDCEYAFRIYPGFHVPDWVKGAVMYQIFIDRFCDGDPSNNVQTNEYIYLGRTATGVGDWNAPVEAFDVHRFYGGDLQGVKEKLSYLYSLGVRVIYFNPLFVSPSNHKYDIQDYDHIDPHIGRIPHDGGTLVEPWEDDNARSTRYSVRTTDQQNLEASDALFTELIQACHEMGIRVIIDGVFNHCGSFNKWMNKSEFYKYKDSSNVYEAGAYQLKASPYHSYFSFADNRDEAWPNNNTYEKWWGNDTLPKLNYEGSRQLEEEILRIGRKWVSPPFNCDGWRLDVAADLGHSAEYNHSFWKKFRKTVKEANPEAVILAEHYGDPYPWLGGDEWDTVMNYDAFMEPVTWFLTGMEKHSDSRNDALCGDGQAFFDTMTYNMAKLPENSILAAMNQLSNHDHSRFMTRTNKTVGRLATMGAAAASNGIQPQIYRLAAMIQMTWPGAPTIFYGDEVGLCGWTEPDCRRTFPWGHEDLELLEYHKYLIQARRGYSVLQNGSLMELMAGHNFIVYARVLSNQVAIVVVNAGPDEFPLQIPVWRTGITDIVRLRRVIKTDAVGYNAGITHRYSVNGILRSYLQPYSGKVYIAEIGPARMRM